jgi:hypothetical protein
MSKAIKRPKVAAGFNIETGLPTPETVNEQVKAITPQQRAKGKTFTLEQATAPPPERTPGLTAKGRVKFTTMLRPDLRAKLETLAASNHISAADVLETIIQEYFDI